MPGKESGHPNMSDRTAEQKADKRNQRDYRKGNQDEVE